MSWGTVLNYLESHKPAKFTAREIITALNLCAGGVFKSLHKLRRYGFVNFGKKKIKHRYFKGYVFWYSFKE